MTVFFDGDFRCREHEDSIEIERYVGKDPCVTFPAEIHGKPVTRIRYLACDWLDWLEKVTFSEGLEHIGGYAFNYCLGLRCLRFPLSLRHLEERAFNGCEGLKWVTIPSSDVEFDANVFLRCDPDLTLYGIPGSSTERYAAANGHKFRDIQTFDEPEIPTREAGDRQVWTSNGIKYAFRWCPAGSFLMGSPEDEPDRDDDETQHRVTLTRGFWMLETEVTQAMWKSVMGTSISQQRDKENTSWPLYGEGSDYPMYYVSWEECRSFCEKLSSQLGLTVSLPTEAQWEYACRAGTTGAYAGDLGEMGWYWDNSGGGTHPVGQKKPNAWGLYDMHGNVEEWCQDWYDYDYYTESPTSDPTGPSSGSSRVYRGGGWYYYARSCRSAVRDGFTPDSRSRSLGFRPVLASPAPGK
ncbi:MAG: SUMF1/EgtB/PvdO family nonheme iron enzyme [Thermoguttaceae bacterium]|nr:SUMF1/EgtB/PvdO family nonheme iron enzyme [Thermoguttaceae bacterium]